MQKEEWEYVGFWSRVWASLIDTVLSMLVIMPLMLLIYGKAYFESTGLIVGVADGLIQWVIWPAVIIAFWAIKQATPGKMAVSAVIVDAKTGQTPSLGQLIGRYLGYYVSLVPFGLGIIWVAFDAKKQGWHDKLAGTVVIRRED